MIAVIQYTDETGACPFAEWLADLNDARAQARIDVRIVRLIEGLFGDCKPLAYGIWELRVDCGPG